VAAALWLYEEELKREFEREKRDREFWSVMFGGEPNTPEDDLEKLFGESMRT
jgi:hypothetical protein